MFDDILQGHYEGWTGLVPQLTLEELVLSVAPAVLHESREKSRIATRFRVSEIQRTTTPLSIEVWSVVGSQQVSIVELDDPLCLDIDLTLDAMGAPELTLEDKRFSVGYVISELFYPQRGIVLSIGDPLASNASRGRKLFHVRLFPPMSLQRYLTHVGESGAGLPNSGA
jgi:hypothetical protein